VYFIGILTMNDEQLKAVESDTYAPCPFCKTDKKLVSSFGHQGTTDAAYILGGSMECHGCGMRGARVKRIKVTKTREWAWEIAKRLIAAQIKLEWNASLAEAPQK
jgi:hypothetical protein